MCGGERRIRKLSACDRPTRWAARRCSHAAPPASPCSTAQAAARRPLYRFARAQPPPAAAAQHPATDLRAGDAKLLVNLMLHRKTVAIPPKATRDVVAGLVRVPRHGVLNCSRKDVPVVRQPSRKRRAVVERVDRATFAELQRSCKSVEVRLTPQRENLFLHLRE